MAGTERIIVIDPQHLAARARTVRTDENQTTFRRQIISKLNQKLNWREDMLQNIVSIDQVIGLRKAAVRADLCAVHLESGLPRPPGIKLRRLDALDVGPRKAFSRGDHRPPSATSHV